MKSIAGGALINLIRERAREESRDNKWLANLMGLSYPYANSILAGAKPIGAIPRERLSAIGSWLGIPAVQVYLLAELMEPKDFFVETSLEDRLMHVYKTMGSDPDWRGFMPSIEEWNSSPLNMRLALSIMYERASEKTLLEKAKMVKVID